MSLAPRLEAAAVRVGRQARRSAPWRRGMASNVCEAVPRGLIAGSSYVIAVGTALGPLPSRATTEARLPLGRPKAVVLDDAYSGHSRCRPRDRSAALRTRPLDHARGPRYHGPRRLPGPDSHRQAIVNLSLLRHVVLLLLMAPEQSRRTTRMRKREAPASGGKSSSGRAFHRDRRCSCARRSPHAVGSHESRPSRRIGPRGCSPPIQALSMRRIEALDLLRRPVSGSSSRSQPLTPAMDRG
jgi:hypothetical protein